MSEWIVRLQQVEIEGLDRKPTINITLPENFRSEHEDRQRLQEELQERRKGDPDWAKGRLDEIVNGREKKLADEEHPLRSYGAGILARVTWPGSNGPQIVLQVRGSNRGGVWPIKRPLLDRLCWKEFAGVTGSADELLNPAKTAIKELYEEIGFISNAELLLPTNLHEYEDTLKQVTVAIKRLKRHYDLNLAPVYGYYPPVSPETLQTSLKTRQPPEEPLPTVNLIPKDRPPETFQAVVNYDPQTSALEMSFVADINLERPLTGIISFSGPEDDDPEKPPYMEDVVVVSEEVLKKEARKGERINVKHLLSRHGLLNLLQEKEQPLYYTPAPTLEPLVDQLAGKYSLRSRLRRVLDALR